MRLEFIKEVNVMDARDPGVQAGLKLTQVKLNRSVIRMPNSAIVMGNIETSDRLKVGDKKAEASWIKLCF